MRRALCAAVLFFVAIFFVPKLAMGAVPMSDDNDPRRAGNSLISEQPISKHQVLPEANSNLPLLAILGFGSLAGSLAACRTRK